LYGAAARLDESPELFFLLRGVVYSSLISEIKLSADLANLCMGKKLNDSN